MSKVNGCIMFTDVVSSSKLWKNHSEQMTHITQTHEQLIMDVIRDNKGMVVKTIGDAVMAYFDTPICTQNAILSAIQIQRRLRNNPILIEHDRIHVRIGICFGEMLKRFVTVQNCCMADYYGPVVNTASRMEGEVSPVDGFALCMPKKLHPIAANLLNLFCHVDPINYTRDCTRLESRTRSARMLSNIGHREVQERNEEELHGVGNNLTLSCTLRCEYCLNKLNFKQ